MELSYQIRFILRLVLEVKVKIIYIDNETRRGNSICPHVVCIINAEELVSLED